MEGIIDISAFMDHLEQHDLVIAPRRLVEKRGAIERKQKHCLRKKMLSFKEISDAGLWGEIQPSSVKAFAKKYAKQGELIQVPNGQKMMYKITIGAVERIAKIRGTWHIIAE